MRQVKSENPSTYGYAATRAGLLPPSPPLNVERLSDFKRLPSTALLLPLV